MSISFSAFYANVLLQAGKERAMESLTELKEQSVENNRAQAKKIGAMQAKLTEVRVERATAYKEKQEEIRAMQAKLDEVREERAVAYKEKRDATAIHHAATEKLKSAHATAVGELAAAHGVEVDSWKQKHRAAVENAAGGNFLLHYLRKRIRQIKAELEHSAHEAATQETTR